MNSPNKLARFEIEDLSRKGFRMYPTDVIAEKDKYTISRVLYYRYLLDSFFVGKVLMVKNRKN